MSQLVTLITHGVKVTVLTNYREDQSNPAEGYYLFSYKITIENYSEFVIQLLSRHWHIFDSSGELKEVKGEGVVGHQPTLDPGQFYEYESACNLTTDLGKMQGTYLMKREIDDATFYVNIPEFELAVPSRLN